MVCVNWNDAQEYLKWLNGSAVGKGYRLLSEAQWEYAASNNQGAPSDGSAKEEWGDPSWRRVLRGGSWRRDIKDLGLSAGQAMSLDTTGQGQIVLSRSETPPGPLGKRSGDASCAGGAVEIV